MHTSIFPEHFSYITSVSAVTNHHCKPFYMVKIDAFCKLSHWYLIFLFCFSFCNKKGKLDPDNQFKDNSKWKEEDLNHFYDKLKFRGTIRISLNHWYSAVLIHALTTLFLACWPINDIQQWLILYGFNLESNTWQYIQTYQSQDY